MDEDRIRELEQKVLDLQTDHACMKEQWRDRFKMQAQLPAEESKQLRTHNHRLIEMLADIDLLRPKEHTDD